jgi:hypothetical protein
MSYDIWLEIDTGGPEPATVAEVGNYTSNVSGMWADALGRSLGDYHGAPCSEAAGSLLRGVERMKADPAHYEAMNPENGWGDYEGALKYLEQLYEACTRHPKATIAIWR